MNPAGGPQNTDNTDIHGNKAKLTLSYVDVSVYCVLAPAHAMRRPAHVPLPALPQPSFAAAVGAAQRVPQTEIQRRNQATASQDAVCHLHGRARTRALVLCRVVQARMRSLPLDSYPERTVHHAGGGASRYNDEIKHNLGEL